MACYSKEQATPFDVQPPEGCFFVDGAMLARMLHTSGQLTELKFAKIAFPSGLSFPIWASAHQPDTFMVHLFDRLYVPLTASAEQAFDHTQALASEHGYGVYPQGQSSLEVSGRTPVEHYLLTYDEEAERLVDVARLQP